MQFVRWYPIVCLPAYLPTYLQPFFEPWQFFHFPDLLHSQYFCSEGDQPVARPLRAHRKTRTQNKPTVTAIIQVGFDPTIPVFGGGAKIVHSLGRATTVIIIDNKYLCMTGLLNYSKSNNKIRKQNKRDDRSGNETFLYQAQNTKNLERKKTTPRT
jgi:hypothetical protein